MSKYDSNRQDMDDLLRQVDALLEDQPEEDSWFDQGDPDYDDDGIDVDEFSPFDDRDDHDPIFYQNYSNDYGRQVRNYHNGYGGQEVPPQSAPPEPTIPAYNADFHPSRRERDTNSQAYRAQKRKQSPSRKTEQPPSGGSARSREARPPKSRRGCGCFPMLLVMAALVVGLCFWLFQPPRSEDSIGQRKPDTATILICGADIGAGRDDSGGSRTDTMMLLYLSGSEKKVGLLSLPRDTYTITSAGKASKLNAAYGRNGTGEEGMEGLMDYVQDIIGYRPDGYILVDMTLVSEISDLMGGIEMDVPQAMEVSGFTLQPGQQHLDGQGILTMLRFRSGYATADLGRVEMQRTVIKACMDQWLRLGNITKLPEALELMQANSISSLSTRNYLWVGKTLLSAMGGGFTTETLPGYADYIGNVSYYLLDREEVARLINDSFNPYQVTIDPEDLNIAG